MGKRGPKPTPTAELEKRGSWLAKTVKRKDEIQVPALTDCPSPPSWLSQKGREVWNEHSGPAFEQGILTALDVMVFGLTCERLAEYLEYRDRLADTGLLVEKENYTGANPLIKASDDAAKSVLGMARECGLTVVSRIGMPKPQTVQPKAGEVIQSQSLFAKG